ncbi:hypothetical protein [Gloeocapsopsis dulcis]|uniref:Uncharacterized protein n=1 Tax=Gloeocapsopsis dulcis AAB1 = 1H9 TaxID=1433147 RepID=A0A6N8G1V7_9CHRO|nr:hypothetical protein [Gloeocapsopsis dulcis]MUL38156.1 hypothetical protein [Gloeocapsopsis dulcis AAB1 = 1H9]WNN90811.1 hypothetical protein P0S91_06970 [Gloeocapsopsis dulcis]
MFRKIVLLSITAIAVIFTWSSLFAYPAASQAQSRINALEVDLRGVQSRLNRIEAQLNRLRGVPSPRTPPTITLPSPPGPRAQLSQDQMFDRLATLVVEVKQQVNKLETRVAALEKRTQ